MKATQSFNPKVLFDHCKVRGARWMISFSLGSTPQINRPPPPPHPPPPLPPSRAGPRRRRQHGAPAAAREPRARPLWERRAVRVRSRGKGAGLGERLAGDTCCLYMPARLVASWLQQAAGETKGAVSPRSRRRRAKNCGSASSRTRARAGSRRRVARSALLLCVCGFETRRSQNRRRDAPRQSISRLCVRGLLVPS